MKTNSIDFHRIGLLFRRYFIENAYQDLIYWICVAVVLTLASALISEPKFVGTTFLIGFLLAGGAGYAARFFREIHPAGTGIASLMLPATAIEKLIVALVLTTVYYFLLVLSAYIVGNPLGTVIHNLLAHVPFLSEWFSPHPVEWQWFSVSATINSFHLQGPDPVTANNYYPFIGFFIRTQAIFLLGSLYFKNYAASKTLLFIVCTGLVLIMYSLTFTAIMPEGGFGSGRLLGLDTIVGIERGLETAFNYLFAPFLWVVSYFRLIEKQV